MSKSIHIITSVWFVFAVTIIILIRYFFPNSMCIPAPLDLTGLLFIGLGLGIEYAIIRLFRINKLNILDQTKPFQFFTDGAYKISRHPMYLSLVFNLFGVWLYIGNLWSFIVIPIFIVIIDEFFIKPEEDALKKKYGIAWIKYCSKVNRWI